MSLAIVAARVGRLGRRYRLSNAYLRRYATEAQVALNLKPTAYGQPLPMSHPHLGGETVKTGELTPGIPASEYEWRRRQLMEHLPEGSVVVSVSAPIKYMSGAIFYKFRQASDFWYLTGLDEPDSAVILEKNSTSKGYRMTLFAYGKDPSKEKWEGARTDLGEVPAIFGADEALPITSFPSSLKFALSNSPHVYLDLPPSSRRQLNSSNSLLKLLQVVTPRATSKSDPETILDKIPSGSRQPLAPFVAQLRAIKSPSEQKVMREAADISGRAHAKTMCFTRPGISESAIGAHFEYLSILGGAQRIAYVPVIASGENALIIHYTTNNHLVRDREMVLMDAGCEYNGYASDISRTYPVNGVFTPAQRALYTAVLTAQKALVSLCTSSSSESLHTLHRKSIDLLRCELNQIGFRLSAGDLERHLYPHFLSHPIGIDLHESDNFDRGGELRQGMVLTIEPGIYVPPLKEFPKEFHGMGIRIEDEVLVGEKHPVVLSVSAPKEIADVEGACQGMLGLTPY